MATRIQSRWRIILARKYCNKLRKHAPLPSDPAVCNIRLAARLSTITSKTLERLGYDENKNCVLNTAFKYNLQQTEPLIAGNNLTHSNPNHAIATATCSQHVVFNANGQPSNRRTRHEAEVDEFLAQIDASVDESREVMRAWDQRYLERYSHETDVLNNNTTHAADNIMSLTRLNHHSNDYHHHYHYHHQQQQQQLSQQSWRAIWQSHKSRDLGECPICLTAWSPTRRRVLLSCSHVLHATCLTMLERFTLCEQLPSDDASAANSTGNHGNEQEQHQQSQWDSVNNILGSDANYSCYGNDFFSDCQDNVLDEQGAVTAVIGAGVGNNGNRDYGGGRDSSESEMHRRDQFSTILARRTRNEFSCPVCRWKNYSKRIIAGDDLAAEIEFV